MSTVAVVGAGIAGLAAAYDLVRAGLDVALLEAAGRTGGVIVSERIPGGWLVEGGPDGFLAADVDLAALAGDLGIAGRIVRQAAHGSQAWDGRALLPLSEGEAATLLGIQVRKEDLAAGHASFADGMGECIAALERQLTPVLRLGAAVQRLERAGGGFRVGLATGPALLADAVVVAAPAHQAARLLDAVSAPAAAFARAVAYAPSLTVSLAYRAEQVGRPLEGTGFVVRGAAGVSLRACTYASSKFPGRAPAGHVLLRAFLAPGAADPPGEAHRLVAGILDLRGAPLWHRVFDWPRGLPAYAEGHGARLARARADLAGAGPLILAGAGYDGSGVSACVRSGRGAAREVQRRLGAATT